LTVTFNWHGQWLVIQISGFVLPFKHGAGVESRLDESGRSGNDLHFGDVPAFIEDGVDHYGAGQASLPRARDRLGRPAK
jgi:hypothetical protein